MKEKTIARLLTGFDGRLRNLAEKVERIDSSMVTRDEFHTIMDKTMVMLVDLQQERIFSSKWINRVDRNLNRINKHLRFS